MNEQLERIGFKAVERSRSVQNLIGRYERGDILHAGFGDMSRHVMLQDALIAQLAAEVERLRKCDKCRGSGEAREYGIGYATVTECTACHGTGRRPA